MEVNYPKLFIEINNSEYIFAVGDKNNKENFQLIHKCVVPIEGIKNRKIVDFDLALKIIKNNIYAIEQKFNFIFKDVILIVNNFDCSFINFTGFKKLNGSQILKENITYILNSLKSNIDKTEGKKTILHIFNSKFMLDKKKIENLPIGLFGDFYSHELSFCLINNNDYKNLNNIFDKCNLKIKKILLKSFIEGSYVSNKNKNLDNFFLIKINEKNSQVSFFENESLKFEQNFDFGSNLVLQDISKITSLKTNIIEKIINQTILNKNFSEDDLIEKNFFENESYIKIKKKLVNEVAEARIQEFFEYIINNNINLSSYKRKGMVLFLNINSPSHAKCFNDLYSSLFSKSGNYEVRCLESFDFEELADNVNNIAHFGWKKEAIPTTQTKKSMINKFFDRLFS